VVRGQFRLHYGGLSYGCITIVNREDFSSARKMILNSTQLLIPEKGNYTPYYGTVTVK